jgi:plasmid maintenance system antidote protein VapI
MGKAGDKIKAEIARRGLTVTGAAKVLQIGRQALSIKLAVKLQKYFGMNAKKLLVMQLNEELAAMEKSSKRSHSASSLRPRQ